MVLDFFAVSLNREGTEPVANPIGRTVHPDSQPQTAPKQVYVVVSQSPGYLLKANPLP